jgi:DNA polymerase-4
MTQHRLILHVDMDAFYAAVECHDRPELKGLPLIVGGTANRGVVAAASYEVRRFGVHSAMPIKTALARCPHAVCVPPRMARYREVSDEVFAVFAEFTPIIEGLSLDEAFLDVTASVALFGSPVDMARAIKHRVRERTGLSCSVGASHNKLLAKLASDMQKPDGLVEIRPQAVTAMLDELPLRRLPGVGPKTLPRLEAAGLATFRDLRLAPDAVLVPVLGRSAAELRARAAGSDDRPVAAHYVEQSVSAEETFADDLVDSQALLAELARLADRASARLRERELEAGRVTVKIRRKNFSTLTRSGSCQPASADSTQLAALARTLFADWRASEPATAVRLLGVGLGALLPAGQLELFAAHAGHRVAPVPPVGRRLDPTLDGIRARFGADAVRRGTSLERPVAKDDGFTDVRRR